MDTAPRDRTNNAASLALVRAGLVSDWAVADWAVANWAVANWAVANWGVAADAAFSIFFWLQVANFDVFLFLVLHVCYLSFVGLFSVCFASVAPNSN